ncbi:MAG: hypothetical protein EPN47_06585 [Acidobacteria bacterium]|nr:MAG: hypothetical protein EPN47_06585 [Acidobacteriota bacterium]
MKVLLNTILSLLLAGALYPARAQIFVDAPEISPRDFALMAWDQSPPDPHQLDLMRQAGLNISGFCSPGELDQVQAAKLSCFVTDDRANGYDWTGLPDEKELQGKIDALVKEVRNHPAALGFFLHDEPPTQMMPGLAKVASMLQQAMPGARAYVNLLPNYATASQLGATSYEAYVQKFVDAVHPPLLSYDNYSLFNGEMQGRFFTNLATIRNASQKAGIPFWNVILANSHFSYMEPTDATLALQAYSTIAYGGRGIEYFTYFSPKVGNFRMAAVDQFGHRTATWYMMRRLNNQIRELAPWLVKLHSTGVYHSAPLPEGAEPVDKSELVKQVRATTFQSPPVAPEYLAGEFRDDEGHPFLMVVNRSLKYSMRYAIDLKDSGQHLVLVSPYTGQLVSFTGEMNWLAPGQGALLEVK